jgi:hypothetical protein
MTEFDQRDYYRCPGEPHGELGCPWCGYGKDRRHLEPRPTEPSISCDSCGISSRDTFIGYSAEHAAWFCRRCAEREQAESVLTWPEDRPPRCMNGIHDTKRCPTCGEPLTGGVV